MPIHIQIPIYKNTFIFDLNVFRKCITFLVSKMNLMCMEEKYIKYVKIRNEGSCGIMLNDLTHIKTDLKIHSDPETYFGFRSDLLFYYSNRYPNFKFYIDTILAVTNYSDFNENRIIPFDIQNAFRKVEIEFSIMDPDPTKLHRIDVKLSDGIALNVNRGDVYIVSNCTKFLGYDDWFIHVWANSHPENNIMSGKQVYIRFDNIPFFTDSRAPGARDGYGNFMKTFILDDSPSNSSEKIAKGYGSEYAGSPAYTGSGNPDMFNINQGITTKIWVYNYQDAKASGLFPNIDSMELNKCYLL